MTANTTAVAAAIPAAAVVVIAHCGATHYEKHDKSAKQAGTYRVLSANASTSYEKASNAPEDNMVT